MQDLRPRPPAPVLSTGSEPAASAAASSFSLEARTYRAPRLEHLGSVRDLTLGQSGGRFNDGISKNRKTPLT